MENGLRECVADLKHDLGKYVAWRTANFDDDAWTGALTTEFVECLQADLLRTKGDLSAWDVWDRHRQAIPEPWPPELEAVDEAVAVLRAHEAMLRQPTEALAAARPVLRRAQQTIRHELRMLARRLANV